MGKGKSAEDFIEAAAALATRAGDGIPTRPLGDTGVEVSILGVGGWHIGAIVDKPEAIRVMHAAIDEGINFFDNSWDYHGGGAEEIMGDALSRDGKRKKVFLMTKNCERDYIGSMRCLEQSLRRLRTEYLDLWQFHELDFDNDPDWIFEKGGLRAALEAQKAGKIRFIGFTGHKSPAIHLAMLDKPHPWDTVQMPINVMDAHYRSFAKEVLPVCNKRKIGIIGMKSLGGGHPHGRFASHTDLPVEACIRYSLGQPISSLVVGMESMADLKQNVAIARGFKPLSAAETTALLEQARAEATDGRHELFKSTMEFDGPHHRAQHGFD